MKIQYHQRAWRLYLSSIVVVVSILGVSFRYTRSVPRPSTDRANHAERFSETRAIELLETLVSFGPRLAGSPSNEVETPIFLINALTKAGITSSTTSWRFEDGLASRHWVSQRPGARDSAHEAEQIDKDATISLNSQRATATAANQPSVAPHPTCVCGGGVTTTEEMISSVLSDTHERIRNAMWICSSSTLAQSHAIPSWVTRIASIIGVAEGTGCTDPQQWISADIALRYLQQGFGVQVPRLTENQLSAQPELERELQTLAADTAASALFMIQLGRLEPLCSAGEKRAADVLGCPVCTFPVDRVILTRRSSSASDVDDMVLMDFSASHNYTGHFVLNIANGGILTNVYQNLTTLATRVLSLPLALAPGENTESILSGYRAWKKRFHEWYMNQHLSPLKLRSLDKRDPSVDDDLAVISDASTIIPEAAGYPYAQRPAFVLASHFDTAVSSPGAADAGSGVAIILEITRNILFGGSAGS